VVGRGVVADLGEAELTASYGQSAVDHRAPEQSINFMRSKMRKCACNFCEAAHLSNMSRNGNEVG